MDRSEVIEDAKAALAGWLPISTAPKSDRIIGWTGHGLPEAYEYTRGNWVPMGAIAVMSLNGVCSYRQPVLWHPMPLLPPPSA